MVLCPLQNATGLVKKMLRVSRFMRLNFRKFHFRLKVPWSHIDDITHCGCRCSRQQRITSNSAPPSLTLISFWLGRHRGRERVKKEGFVEKMEKEKAEERDSSLEGRKWGEGKERSLKRVYELGLLCCWSSRPQRRERLRPHWVFSLMRDQIILGA